MTSCFDACFLHYLCVDIENTSNALCLYSDIENASNSSNAHQLFSEIKNAWNSCHHSFYSFIENSIDQVAAWNALITYQLGKQTYKMHYLQHQFCLRIDKSYDCSSSISKMSE